MSWGGTAHPKESSCEIRRLAAIGTPIPQGAAVQAWTKVPSELGSNGTLEPLQCLTGSRVHSRTMNAGRKSRRGSLDTWECSRIPDTVTGQSFLAPDPVPLSEEGHFPVMNPGRYSYYCAVGSLWEHPHFECVLVLMQSPVVVGLRATFDTHEATLGAETGETSSP